jgi:hypothetical protein
MKLDLFVLSVLRRKAVGGMLRDEFLQILREERNISRSAVREVTSFLGRKGYIASRPERIPVLGGHCRINIRYFITAAGIAALDACERLRRERSENG